MPRERPTRTESIFVRSNVLPPLRPAPFLLVPFVRYLARIARFIRTVSTRSLASSSRDLSTRLLSAGLMLLIVLHPDIESRYAMRRSPYLTWRAQTKFMLSTSSEKRESKRNTYVKCVASDVVFCSRDRFLIDFFPQSEISKISENLSEGVIVNLFNSRSKSKMVNILSFFFS